MEIKGNIGEEVMVKAVIESVTVRKDEIVYSVKINNRALRLDPGTSTVEQIPEEEITFITKEKKPRAEKKPKAPKKEEKTAAAPEAPKRRPGRPKKATVEGTMRKYEEMMARNEVSLDDGIDG